MDGGGIKARRCFETVLGHKIRTYCGKRRTGSAVVILSRVGGWRSSPSVSAPGCSNPTSVAG